MIVVATVLAAVAAAIHVYIFVLESVRWEEPATRRVFGTSTEQARVTKELALNQGFYNLFLAVVTVVGLVLLWTGPQGEGAALVLAGAGSMLAAAVVLASTSPAKRRAALVQGTMPLLAVVSLVAGLVT